MHSGSVHTFIHPAPQKNVQVARNDARIIPRGMYSGSYLTRPRLLRKQRSGNKRKNMADEDVEMDNFSEERAESASDFAGDDENDKVV